MELYEIKNELELLLDNESTRIIDALLEMYYKKTKVNKSFDMLVKDLLNKEFIQYETTILAKVVALIPEGLVICPNNEWIFIKEEELIEKSQSNNIIDEINKNKDLIEKLSNLIVLNYKQDKLKQKNILEIIYKYTPENIFINIDSDAIVYIIQHIIFKINETHHVSSINPFIIEEL